MDKMVLGKTIGQWVEKFPIIDKLISYKPVFWTNKNLDSAYKVLPELSLTFEDMVDTEKRLERFAPLISVLFPETAGKGGLIESELVSIGNMKISIQKVYRQDFQGELMLKCDN